MGRLIASTLKVAAQITWVGAAAALTLAGTGGAAHAQQPALDLDKPWVETEAPPPPAFDDKKLVVFDTPVGSSLTFSIAPETITISKPDSLVRYVIVASNPGGAKNVMYEGLRCATGEVKTYARTDSNGIWRPVSDAPWRSVYGSSPSRHALRLARGGACDNAAPASSVNDMLRNLKNGPSMPGGSRE